MIRCHYFPACTACSFWDQDYVTQKDFKLSTLRNLLKQNNLIFSEVIDFLSCGEFGLRTKTDFTFEYSETEQKHKFGFYNKNRELQDVQLCLQLAPELQKLYAEFIKFKFYVGDTPLKKGSIRLRISPSAKKSCWLDLANIDIKNLLEDKILLQQLLDADYFVEIGQKAKSLTSSPQGLKLTEPKPQAWFETYSSTGKKLALNCCVSDFTQPSWASAELLVKSVQTWIESQKSIQTVIEFGCGIGQFTLNFLSQGLSVNAFEIDASATEQLKQNAHFHHLSQNLKIHRGDFHHQSIDSTLKPDLAFVNPARSGLKAFTQQIIRSSAQYIIYVSCFPESMCQDLKTLSAYYKIKDLKIVDQFPQTEHFESIAFLEKLS